MTEQQQTKQNSRDSLVADSLATGVFVALALMVVQRLTGFLRSVLFCRFLDDSELGLWSLAFSFLLLAAPLAVLGLPGTFGRYVEHYRGRGQLRQFLRRTTVVSVFLVLVATVLVVFGKSWIAKLIFNDSGETQLVLVIAVSLVLVVAFNFVVELLTALRQVRFVSLLQFASSIVFTIVGLSLAYFTSLGATGVVIGYAAGCGLACFAAIGVLRRCWTSLDKNQDEMTQGDLWSKLVPFAAWVWVINLLTNLFEAADRYMIVHFAIGTAQQAQALVGQYHSSRIVPLLMVAVAGMLGGVLLPYLTADWEAGRRTAVARQLNLALKLIAVAFTVGGVLILYLAPLLFGWALDGRYNSGLAVLPWTLIYCIWFSLTIVAQNYLWCAEKAKLASIALVVGLILNLELNAILLPMFGLLGAVLATSAANLIALGLIYLLNWRSGMQVDGGVLVLSCVPLALSFGAGGAAAILLIVILADMRMNVLFDASEKDQLSTVVGRYVRTTKKYFWVHQWFKNGDRHRAPGM